MQAPPEPRRATAALPKAALQHLWHRQGVWAWLLRPWSWLYGALAFVRQALYRWGWLKAQHPGVPVIVVGNVIAGGAGKTPVVMAVVRHLQAQGWQPGVISRGYGRNTQDCRNVLPDSTPAEVGDEPALIARYCQVPVAVAAQRIDAARHLLTQHPGTNVLISDDGLQHWALARDVEICVFNHQGIGNGWLLPAGPLREPWPRPVDLVVYAGSSPPSGPAPAFALQRELAPWAIRADGSKIALDQLQGQPVVAVAAIAHPTHFFTMLEAAGLPLVATVALPDHFSFQDWVYPIPATHLLICTEKDAAKLWPLYPNALAIPLHVQIAPEFFAALDSLLAQTLSSPSLS